MDVCINAMHGTQWMAGREECGSKIKKARVHWNTHIHTHPLLHADKGMGKEKGNSKTVKIVERRSSERIK